VSFGTKRHLLLDFATNRFLMKLLKTNNVEIIASRSINKQFHLVGEGFILKMISDISDRDQIINNIRVIGCVLMNF